MGKVENIIYMINKKDLHILARHGSFSEFKSSYKPDALNSIDADGYSLLHNAIAGRNFDTAQFLVDHDINVMLRDADGMTVLHYLPWYISDKNEEVVLSLARDILLKCNKEELNFKDDVYENTALMSSLVNLKSYKLVKLLLEEGSDPTIENKNGISPIKFLKARKNSTLDDIFSHLV